MASSRSPLPSRHAKSKRAAFLVLLAGVIGAFATALPSLTERDPDAKPPSRELPRAPEQPARAPRSALPPGPVVPPPSKDADPPAPSRGDTVPLPIRVNVGSGGAADVLVRTVNVARDAGNPASETPCLEGCSAPVRTDDAGVANLGTEREWLEAVAKVAPPSSPSTPILELARSDVTGFRHGFVVLEKALLDGPRPIDVTLPEGGSIRVELRGIPAESRPAAVLVEFLAPYGPFREMFSDLQILPTEDGGLFEMRQSWRRVRVKIGEDGVGILPHAPTDHAIWILVPEMPEGWQVESTTWNQAKVATREGDVLRVKEGTAGTYGIKFRRAPSATVHVTDLEGAPVRDAHVTGGMRAGDGFPRLLGSPMAVDGTGTASVPLWTGERQPDWTPSGLVFVATAPGREAKVVESAGRWEGVELSIRLAPAPKGSFTVGGKLKMPSGRPAVGIPVRLACAEPWNGQAALEPHTAMTDPDGGFRFEVSEAERPVFAFGGGLRVHIDVDRLETQADDALWRARWPELPRLKALPAVLELPKVGGSSQVDLQLGSP